MARFLEASLEGQQVLIELVNLSGIGCLPFTHFINRRGFQLGDFFIEFAQLGMDEIEIVLRCTLHEQGSGEQNQENGEGCFFHNESKIRKI